MIDVIVTMILGFVFLVLQSFFRLNVFGGSFEIGFVFLLVVYAGFSGYFFRGLIIVLLLSIMLGAFSFIPYSLLILIHLIIFLCIQLLQGQILAEAYLTKSLWSVFFLLIHQIMIRMIFNPFFLADNIGVWGGLVLQSLIGGMISLPLFIFLDAILPKIKALFGIRQASLTGVDFYELKSKQRKYLK